MTRDGALVGEPRAWTSARGEGVAITTYAEGASGVEHAGLSVSDTREPMAGGLRSAGSLTIEHSVPSDRPQLHVARVWARADARTGEWGAWANVNDTRLEHAGCADHTATGLPAMSLTLLSASTQGAGLGIAIASEHVEAGSSIRVASIIIDMDDVLAGIAWGEEWTAPRAWASRGGARCS